ncbi:hypothetical protein WOLCODRAFT_166833 [Wolfiporia cocos MD-104 SS10]|uniref:Uncharacterized protein n=1 Tax=Wolfiporia cocos (strain MD-104) TaxID=742152 RepID=A0A2H3JF41_WOLCO|nr:hypothetical protein WOLCODRAFT_166833 [Wolfiporia cocos MD-104 SS10]
MQVDTVDLEVGSDNGVLVMGKRSDVSAQNSSILQSYDIQMQSIEAGKFVAERSPGVRAQPHDGDNALFLEQGPDLGATKSDSRSLNDAQTQTGEAQTHSIASQDSQPSSNSSALVVKQEPKVVALSGDALAARQAVGVPANSSSITFEHWIATIKHAVADIIMVPGQIAARDVIKSNNDWIRVTNLAFNRLSANQPTANSAPLNGAPDRYTMETIMQRVYIPQTKKPFSPLASVEFQVASDTSVRFGINTDDALQGQLKGLLHATEDVFAELCCKGKIAIRILV